MNITVHSTAHGIAFYNTRQRVLQSNCNDKNENRQFVEICEVNVLGCDATRYSENCSHECDRICLNQHCDAYNGEFIYGCSEPHRAGPHCTDCQKGYYGVKYTHKCGHCIDKHDCNKTTGVCFKGCLPHWNGPKCDEKGSSSGLHIAIIAVTSTLLVISVLVNVILVFRKQRRQSSTQHVNNQPEQNHTEMEETREYDKIGVRNTDEYQEMSPTVIDQSPQDRASAYINLS
ncbi:uncharacterized protein LOC125660827 isoform X1 [Ostrea edulis]|uniref:uncharacterized protein LOC125660827 isoform X1 n=1 Tax=Ostrea edulis TaxID=37623 RepID=UPI0024AEFDCF|nr:uncharacterized protein LOC125660827 isoform X1 [Ostrea edulis]